jgi:hypothetical protein
VYATRLVVPESMVADDAVAEPSWPVRALRCLVGSTSLHRPYINVVDARQRLQRSMHPATGRADVLQRLRAHEM